MRCSEVDGSGDSGCVFVKAVETGAEDAGAGLSSGNEIG